MPKEHGDESPKIDGKITALGIVPRHAVDHHLAVGIQGGNLTANLAKGNASGKRSFKRTHLSKKIHRSQHTDVVSQSVPPQWLNENRPLFPHTHCSASLPSSLSSFSPCLKARTVIVFPHTCCSFPAARMACTSSSLLMTTKPKPEGRR